MDSDSGTLEIPSLTKVPIIRNPAPALDITAGKKSPSEVLRDPRFLALSPKDKATLMRHLQAKMSGAAASAPAPARGTSFSPTITPGQGIKRPLPAAELQTAATVKSIQDQLVDLKSKMQAYGQQKWDRNIGTRWYQYEKRKHLHASTDDPQLNELIDRSIAVEAQAQAALAHSSGTRAYQFVAQSSGHIPHGAGDYQYNQDAINFLLDKRGPYQSALRGMGLPDYTPAAPEAVATPDANNPVSGGPAGADPVADLINKHSKGTP